MVQEQLREARGACSITEHENQNHMVAPKRDLKKSCSFTGGWGELTKGWEVISQPGALLQCQGKSMG